jgi:hypothetical protein
VGLAYDDGRWLAQLEASYTASGLDVLPSAAAGYFSFGRRFGAVTAYSLYGVGESMKHRVRLPALALKSPTITPLWDAVDAAFNQNGLGEQSLSLGLRWDVYQNIALKAQWTHFWLERNGVVLWDELGTGPSPGQVNLWSMGVDFIF